MFQLVNVQKDGELENIAFSIQFSRAKTAIRSKSLWLSTLNVNNSPGIALTLKIVLSCSKTKSETLISDVCFLRFNFLRFTFRYNVFDLAPLFMLSQFHVNCSVILQQKLCFVCICRAYMYARSQRTFAVHGLTS